MESTSELPAELERLAVAWLSDITGKTKTSEAWWKVRELTASNPDAAWRLGLALLKRVPADKLVLVGDIFQEVLGRYAVRFVEDFR